MNDRVVVDDAVSYTHLDVYKRQVGHIVIVFLPVVPITMNAVISAITTLAD